MRAAVAALTLALSAATASAGWWEDAAKARESNVAELRASADRLRDVAVTCVVRFVRTAEPPAADAEFPSSEWRAFVASAPDAKDAVLDRLLVRRGSAEESRLDALVAGTELRVRAVVRRGGPSPALEVIWISGPADALSPEELASLQRAESLREKDNPAAAATLLRAVLAGREFAPSIRADLLRRIGLAEKAAGRLDAAVAALRDAAACAPDDRDAAIELARAEKALAARPARNAAPPQGTAAKDAPAIPPRPEIPVPTTRLAGPRDRDAAPAVSAPPVSAPPVSTPPAPAAPTATPAATKPSAPAPQPPAPVEEAPPPPPRLAPPK